MIGFFLTASDSAHVATIFARHQARAYARRALADVVLSPIKNPSKSPFPKGDFIIFPLSKFTKGKYFDVARGIPLGLFLRFRGLADLSKDSPSCETNLTEALLTWFTESHRLRSTRS